MTDKEKLQELFEHYLAGTCSAEDRYELALLAKKLDDGIVSSLLKEAWEKHRVTETLFSPAETEAFLSQITGLKKRGHPVISLFRRRWLRVAAAVLVAVIAGGYFLLKQPSASKHEIIVQTEATKHIAPGGNKATLTLADGTVVVLDTAQKGGLTRQGNTDVIKLADGQIEYNERGNSKAVVYNIITTPRGGQYQLALADGSKVWLNAASSLRFPVAFTGAGRQVELTGEAYFEVVHNPSMPFRVKVPGKQEVEVLGTHFNINSYIDEAEVNTTLLEGSVKVLSESGQKVILQPGEQAQLSENIKVKTNVDTDEVVAWKTGWFNFNRMDVAAIMRQVSRWYDLDVVFEGNTAKRSFSGIVSRNNNVSEVLRIMEKAGVKFRIEGRKITVIQ